MQGCRSLVVVVVLPLWLCIGVSCQDKTDAPLSQSSSTSPVSGDAPTVTIGEVSCTYTDPGAGPISVHRALSCPDGTRVWVRGAVMAAADGTRWICDDDGSQTASGCAAQGLQVVGVSASGNVELTGKKSGITLLLDVEPAPTQSLPTIGVLAVTSTT